MTELWITKSVPNCTDYPEELRDFIHSYAPLLNSSRLICSRAHTLAFRTAAEDVVQAK